MSEALKSCCSYVPERWVIVFMGFFGLLMEYGLRICLSIAITEMVLPIEEAVEYADDTCPNNNVNETEFKNETVIKTGLYDWSEYTQGIILSSFYWGYLFTNLLGGLIAEKLGGKHTLGLSILFTSVLTLAVPATVNFGGSGALICLRVLMGLGEGATYPALNVLLAHWIPEDERSKAGAVTFSGAPIGTIFGTMASGVILRYSSVGWPAVFYFFGGAGILSFLLNTAFCYSKPSEHPFITKEEAKYLKEKLTNTHSNIPPTPWGHILRSGPVWAVVVATIGNAWGFLTMVNDMPKYLSSVLKFSVQDNGYLSSLPYLCMWLCSMISSAVADAAISRRKLSVSAVRKIGCTIASLGPGLFLLAASYAGCDGYLAVALLTTGLTFKGCASFSILVNALDLGPNYAGSLMALINGVSTLSGIVSPYIVGLITPHQTVGEWRAVFWIVFAFYVASNVVFLVYGTGELQEWNDPAFLTKEKKRDRADDKDVIQLLPIKTP